MLIKRLIYILIVSILILGIVTGCGTKEAPQEPKAENGTEQTTSTEGIKDYPVRAIELYVHTDPGTGTDRTARALVDAITKHNLLPVPIQVLNLPGGGGNVVRARILEQNDPHVIVSSQPTAITNPLRTGQTDQYIQNFTPIAVMAVDHNVVVVRADAPWDNLDSLLKTADTEPIIVVGGAMGGGSSISHALLQRASGVKYLEYLPLGESSQAPASVLGGHAHAMIANPPEIVDLVEAGRLKVIGVLSLNRLDIFPDAPTARELGYDVVNMSFRGLMGPPAMTEEQARYLSNVAEKAAATDEWREYILSVGADPLFLNYDETKKYFEEMAVLYEEILDEMGLIDKQV